MPSGWERFLPLRRGGRGSESEEDCGRASMEGGGSTEGSKGEGDWIGGRALLWAESLSRDELLNAWAKDGSDWGWDGAAVPCRTDMVVGRAERRETSEEPMQGTA